MDRPQILIIDDSAHNVPALTKVLGRDYKCLLADSGRDALEMIAAHRPDLILLDVLMPTMDGFEVCRQLKDDPATREIPIIFLTMKDNEDDVAMGFELGAADYITRPFQATVLLARIKTHLNLSRANRSLRESEQKYRLFSEFSNHWEYWIDPQGKPVFFSPSFTTITGYDCAAFDDYYAMMEQLLHPEDRQLWRSHLEDPPAADTAPLEFRIIHKDGRTVWISHTCRRVRDSEGQDLGIRGSNQDITETKRLQAEIKTLQGIIPICASCKKIRDDEGYWEQIEAYIARHSPAEFSHGICPDCMERLYPEFADK